MSVAVYYLFLWIRHTYIMLPEVDEKKSGFNAGVPTKSIHYVNGKRVEVGS